MLCISACLLPLCVAVLWRIELGCSWWDCIDGTCLFLQTLLCASPIYAHPENLCRQTRQRVTQNGKTPHTLFPFSPLPALMAAEARHIRHTCGLLPFSAVCGEVWPGSGAVGRCTPGGVMWDDALLGEWCTRVGWCLPESRPALSHLPSPLGRRTLHLISLHTIYHLWACL